jgi:hypothetical protein
LKCTDWKIDIHFNEPLLLVTGNGHDSRETIDGIPGKQPARHFAQGHLNPRRTGITGEHQQAKQKDREAHKGTVIVSKPDIRGAKDNTTN